MSAPNREKIYKVLKRKSVKRKIKKSLSVVISTLVFFIFISSIFFLTPLFKIGRITVTEDANGVLSKSDIRVLIEDLVSRAPYSNFSLGIGYLYFPKKLTAKLKSANYNIHSVDVDWSWWNTWDVSIIERKAFGYTCHLGVCFLVDRGGLVFRESSTQENIQISIRGSVPKVGGYIVRSDEFSFIRKIIDFIDIEIGLQVVGLDRLSEGQYKGHYVIRTTTGQNLYVKPDDSIYRLTRAIYIAVKEVFGFIDAGNPGDIEGIDDIDFRFGDKLFFKKKLNEN